MEILLTTKPHARLKVFALLFEKSSKRCEAPYKQEYDLIIICGDLYRFVHFCVHRNEPKRHLRGGSRPPLKKLHPPKGSIPFETLAMRLSSRYVKSGDA